MKRSRITLTVLSIMVLAVGFAAAQNGTPAADPSAAFEASGTVISFTAGSRSGMPQLVLDDPALGILEIGLGPAWYLQREGFAASPGDQVDLLAYPCPTCSADAVAAWINNISNGTSVELRDETGRPLWIGAARGEKGGTGQGSGEQAGEGGGGSMNGGGDHDNSGNGGTGQNGAGGLAMDQVETVTGVVVSFPSEPGVGNPIMELSVEGQTLEILVSPFSVVYAAGLTVEPGTELTVTFAPTIDDPAVLVTIAIIDPVTGLTIQLRDPETGFPMTGQRRGRS